MNRFHLITLTLLIPISTTIFSSQAQTKALATVAAQSPMAKELQRWRALSTTLAECLESMPFELIRLITSYEPRVLQGQRTKSLKSHSNEIITFLPLPDDTIASGSADHTITIWNIAAGRCEQILTEHQAPVCLLTAMPDGRFMSFDTRGISITWKKNNANKWALHYARVTNSPIRSCLAPQNHEAIVGLSNGKIEWWEEDSFKQQWEYRDGYTMHAHSVTSLAPLSAGRFASQSCDRLIVWELQKDKAWWTNPRNAKASPWLCSILTDNGLEYPTHITHFSLASLPNNILVEGTPQGIRVWYEREKMWESFPLLDVSGVSALATLQDGRFAARIGNAIKIFVYNAENKNWELAQTVELQDQQSSNSTNRIRSSQTLAVLTSGELAAGTVAPNAQVSDPYEGRIEVVA